jgi:(p)ppGpp synthase/HD superfamily hydrolase
MDLELYFGSIKSEIEKKNHSLLEVSKESENEFLDLCQNKTSREDYLSINSALDFSREIKSIDKNHQSSSAYFIHAIRVATHITGTIINPDIDSIKTGLIHNVFEISGMTDKQILSSGFSEFTVRAIELTTINRKKQFNDEYLKNYYKAIVDFDERLVLIRCLDKLDNLLGLEVIANGELRDNWLRTVEKFIIPLALSLNKDLGDFMKGVIEYTKNRGFNEDLKSELEKYSKKIN